MSTKDSPYWKLAAEARRMVEHLRKMPRDAKDQVTFGVVMDDKMFRVTWKWADIDAMSDAFLRQLIIEGMRGTQH